MTLDHEEQNPRGVRAQRLLLTLRMVTAGEMGHKQPEAN
jgi:hypothetical protein